MAEQSARKRRWRDTGWGAVVLSPDLLLGMPLGFVAAASSLFSMDVREAMPTLLLGVAAVGAAVATLVLTSLMVLIGTVSPVYRKILESVSGGVAGTAQPFRWVAGVAAASTAWALVAAGLAPLTVDSGWQSFLLAAPAFGLLLWAVFGCVQITNQLVAHWNAAGEAEALDERRRRALNKSA